MVLPTVYFATSARHPDLTADDLVAAAALRGRGVEVRPLVWSGTPLDQVDEGAAVVIRSCWDYHVQSPAFSAWLSRLAEAGVRTINSVPLLRWNLHKGYLRELEEKGAPIVPTVFLERGPGLLRLRELLASAGWSEAVVKPAVSLSAHETWRVSVDGAAEHQTAFDLLRLRGDLLVQRYIPEIGTGGEWSLVFFDGRYSHAVLKLPARGDFRVQQEHGGRARAVTPSDRVIRQAADILSLLPEPPTYARVDGVEVRSRLLLMELECIDPVLFFGYDDNAAGRFADAVLREIGVD